MDSDFHLRASERQNRMNEKFRKALLGTEAQIAELHTKEYTSPVQYQLTCKFKLAEEELRALTAGLKWSLTTLYDLPSLMRDCGLELSIQELYRPGQSPEYFELIPVIKEAQILRSMASDQSDARPLLLECGITEAAKSIEETMVGVERKVKQSQLDGTDLAHICDGLLPRLRECLHFREVDDSLRETASRIDVKDETFRTAKTAHLAAVEDGDTHLAEETAYTMIAGLEDLVELLGEKFGVINGREEANDTFFDILTVCRDTVKKTQQMKQESRRLRQRCEIDLKSLHSRIEIADGEDVGALKAWEEYQQGDDEARQNNIAEHAQLLKDMVANKYTMRLDDILSRLKEVGRERNTMVLQRIEAISEEEQRRTRYQQFLETVGQHKRMLEMTIQNCNLKIECVGQIEQASCKLSTSLRSWYDSLRRNLQNLKVNVHTEHFRYFRELYLCIGTLLYKKRKRLEEIDSQLRKEHIHMEFCLETFDVQAKHHSDAKHKLMFLRRETQDEFSMLQDKAHEASDEFEESRQILEDEGFVFTHPSEELNKSMLDQRAKIVAYKAQQFKEEDLRIAAEQEEIRRIQYLRHRPAEETVEEVEVLDFD